MSVDDHIKAHLLLAECFDNNSHEQIGNLRSAKLLSKNSEKYISQFKKIYENQRGDNNPAKRADVRLKILESLKKYYSKNSEKKKGKTYEEIYGNRAEEEKLKRKKCTRTKESYKQAAAKASKKLKGKLAGSKNPNAKKIKVNGVIYGSIRECLDTLNISKYILMNKYKYTIE